MSCGAWPQLGAVELERLMESLEPAMKTTKAFQSAQLTLGDICCLNVV